MRSENLFFSAIQSIVIAALFGLGAVFFGLHFAPAARIALSQWLQEPGVSFLAIGATILLVTLALTFGFVLMQRGSYVRLEMSSKIGISIQDDLIRDALKIYWKKELSQYSAPSEIYLAKNRIELVAKAPPEEGSLEEIEQKVATFLDEEFGYKEPFYLTIKS